MNTISKAINIYTDGSCLFNGRENPIAAIGIWPEGYDDCSISEVIDDYPQTNQVAELVALKRGLDIGAGFQKIRVFTDSMYTINCLTVWYNSWKKKGFRTSKGKRPANLDLIMEIVSIMDTIGKEGSTIELIHVDGHSGNIGNTMAHNLAIAASRNAQNTESKTNN